jgi:hypothetical protein
VKPNYSDITDKLGEPIWWDDNGVPRYCDFSTMWCGVYVDAVALIRIACQDCGREFLVAKEIDPKWRRIWLPSWECKRPNPGKHDDPWIEIGSLHYGDPPRHGCVGDTMNSIPLEILEFWERPDYDWERVADCEGKLSPHDTDESAETAQEGVTC